MSRVGRGARRARVRGDRDRVIAAEHQWAAGPVAPAPTLQIGSLRGGGYAQLGADDNSYYSVNSTASGTRTTAWYGRVSGVPRDLRNLRVAYKAKSNYTCTQTTRLPRST